MWVFIALKQQIVLTEFTFAGGDQEKSETKEAH